jgi:hypothetical protein
MLSVKTILQTFKQQWKIKNLFEKKIFREEKFYKLPWPWAESEKNKLSQMNLKKENKKVNGKIDLENFTTYSIYSAKDDKKSLNYQNEESQNSSDEFSFPSAKILIPIIYLPLALHCGMCLVDGVFYGKFIEYSVQNFLKHTFLINCFNSGILVGYKLNAFKAIEELPNKEIYTSLLLTVLSFITVNALVFQPLSWPVFNILYGSTVLFSYKIAQNVQPIFANYSSLSSKLLLGLMIVMMFLVNYNLSQYRKKIQEQGKFEEVVKFYELASDKDFKKVMNNFEEFLAEIDIKVEKSKD